MEEKLLEKLNELKSDERLTYPAAVIFSNAPLALIQQGMMCQVNLIEDILDLPLSSLPLKKQ